MAAKQRSQAEVLTSLERHVVEPVGLVMPAAQQNRAVHRPIILQGPADLRAAVAEAPAAAQELEVEESVDAAMAKLGPDAERHDARLPDAPQTAEQGPEPEREEAPASEAREGLIDVQNGQAKRDGAPTDALPGRLLRGAQAAPAAMSAE